MNTSDCGCDIPSGENPILVTSKCVELLRVNQLDGNLGCVLDQQDHFVTCLMQGRRTSASLMVANLTDPDGQGSGKGGSRGLYSLFWQLRGDMCGVRTDFR